MSIFIWTILFSVCFSISYSSRHTTYLFPIQSYLHMHATQYTHISLSALQKKKEKEKIAGKTVKIKNLLTEKYKNVYNDNNHKRRMLTLKRTLMIIFINNFLILNWSHFHVNCFFLSKFDSIVCYVVCIELRFNEIIATKWIFFCVNF